ncbi:hypothetical protein C8R44DRAFT_981484 [Mycena epipterygia]|nr:hypothetical protein C8R44DRAFT_981484 [Mycena epipterygia]
MSDALGWTKVYRSLSFVVIHHSPNGSEARFERPRLLLLWLRHDVLHSFHLINYIAGNKYKTEVLLTYRIQIEAGTMQFFAFILSALLSISTPADVAPTKELLTDVTCNIFVKDVNGTNYGYIKPVLNWRGIYQAFQPTQDGALVVSFSYSDSPNARRRLNLRTLNGPTAGTPYPFLGGIVLGNFRLGLYPGSYSSVPLGGTTDTPPPGLPRVFTKDNSWSAISKDATYVESPIWSYYPDTQRLIAQWINPDGGEPATTMIFGEHTALEGLALAGDLQAKRNRNEGSFYAVEFTCVPTSVPNGFA